MLLRKRKGTSEPQKLQNVVPKAHRGLAAAEGRNSNSGGGGSSSNDAPATSAPNAAAATDQPHAVLTPPVAMNPSSRRRPRKPPQDIGIPGLLLGTGMAAAEAADVIDHTPLAAAGFTHGTLRAACEFLTKADPKLVELIGRLGPPERLLAKRGSNFATLAKAIVFQQLATQAASVIYGRVVAACACSESLTPDAVLAAPLPALRQAGLSERKASYIVDLAQHFSDGRLSDEGIAGMDEAALEAALCAVRGIGVWTCHMHAMFHLGSPDVLPTGDLGVRRGMQQLYGLKALPDAAAMAKIAEKWRPYRSVGSYFMWKVDVPRSAPKSKRPKS